MKVTQVTVTAARTIAYRQYENYKPEITITLELNEVEQEDVSAFVIKTQKRVADLLDQHIETWLTMRGYPGLG